MSTENYLATAGQTYIPFQKNIYVPTLAYTPLSPPNPPLPPLELNQTAKEKGWILTNQAQHLLPGITPEMLDWFWANMEKGYYLWAPGSHKRFNWVREPWRYGFLNSAHMISETVGEGKPVFGGSGVEIRRLNLSYFPFTTHLEHVICEGVFNRKEEFVDSTVHMWQATEGGCIHVTASVASTTITEPPAFVLEMIKNGEMTVESQGQSDGNGDHAEYEAAMWPRFLPTLYHLWEGHPDPSQNVQCNLTVKDGPAGLEYLNENGPVAL